ncbi:hypothetical protein QBD00_004600 [Ochrobactrum sp. AN78]|nr:hypothetical protein [Ochrobactrum sp. AN78]
MHETHLGHHVPYFETASRHGFINPNDSQRNHTSTYDY